MVRRAPTRGRVDVGARGRRASSWGDGDVAATTVLRTHWNKWLDGVVDDYRDRIIPVTMAIVERWATVTVPDPVPVVDGLLAATAIELDLVLVTRNGGDVDRRGVVHIDPFTSGPAPS